MERRSPPCIEQWEGSLCSGIWRCWRLCSQATCPSPVSSKWCPWVDFLLWLSQSKEGQHSSWQMLERQKQTAIGLGRDVFIRAGGRAHFPTLAWQKCRIILRFLSTNQMLCSSGVGDWEFDSKQWVSPIAKYSCGHLKLLERAVSSYSRWLHLEMDSEAAKKFVKGKAETICNQNIINLSWALKLVKCLLTALDSYGEDSKLWFETGMETRI